MYCRVPDWVLCSFSMSHATKQSRDVSRDLLLTKHHGARIGRGLTQQKRAQKRATSLLLQASSDMDTQEPAASRMPKNLRAAKAVAMKE